MKRFNNEATQLKESVFSTITQLSIKHQAINLAQGFPDFEGPEWLLDLASKALYLEKNQYAPSYGILPLREAISRVYNDQYGLNYNPANEILVTNGATEAIYCTIRALVNPGDEVVAFEPLYDSYGAAVDLCKGVLKPVTLKLPDYKFDVEELLSKVSDQTKLLILNNPHNPTGRVFTPAELKLIAELAVKHDFYILSDEVYEFLSFENHFKPTATLEGLRERVITISSVGKTFSLTGWKVGWVCAPAEITKVIHNVHQFVTFCVAHPLQVALVEALNRLTEYLIQFHAEYKSRKQILIQGLTGLDYKIIPSQGTYFVTAHVPAGYTDWTYSQYLVENKKVAAIPLSPFYKKSEEGQGLIRFCFAKKEQTLTRAIENLKGQSHS